MKNQHEWRWVRRKSGASSTSVISEKIWFEEEVNRPFMDKRCPGEVSKHEKLTDTHLSVWWELSNNVDDMSNRAMVWSQRAKEKTGVFLLIRHFPSKIIHFLVYLWWIWRGEKALNLVATIADKLTVGIVIRQLQVRGLILSFIFDGLKLQIRVLNSRNFPYFLIEVR